MTKNRLVWAAAAGLGLTLALIWWFAAGAGGGATVYDTVAADRGNLRQSVSANGTVNPVVVVNVGTQISGTVKGLHADFNDKVTQGQIILEIDDRLLRAALSQSEANLANAKAQEELAAANVRRAKQTAASGAGSRAALDQAEAQLSAARAQVAVAEAGVLRDQTNLEFATIRAPVSGTVLSREVDIGQTVAASLQTPTLFKIAQDLSRMQINAAVAEADVGGIRAGAATGFRVDAYPGRQFTGTVDEVRIDPVTNQNVVTYTVVIAISNDDGALLPGMTAYVTIETGARENVLRVPNAALRYRPPSAEGAPQRGGGGGEGGAAVFVLQDGAPKRVRIATGLSDGRMTEVTGGELNEGDQVIVGDNSAGARPAQQTPPGGMPGGGGGRGRIF